MTNLYHCMAHGTTSRYGFYEPEFYLPDTHTLDVAAKTPGKARAIFTKYYHFDFTMPGISIIKCSEKCDHD